MNELTVRKYAEYFLTNNREVMEPADIAELEQALTNSTTTKNWVDDMPEAGVYLVKNIRFEDNGKPIDDCLHATQFTWKQLNGETADGQVCYNDENDCLLAYYRTQAFLYYDCLFDVELVRDKKLRNHLLEVNNLIADSQPYDYAYDLGSNYQTTDELVEFFHPETWLAVIPDGYENCLSYLNDPERTKMLNQAVYEYLIHTLPVNIFSKAHHLTRTPLTNPNDLADLAGFDIPADTEYNFKKFVVNNAFTLPMEFKYQQYKNIQ